MCGRYNIETDAHALRLAFELMNEPSPQPPLTNYNAAPTQYLPVVVETQGERACHNFQWGLVPSWIKEKQPKFRPINAKVETAFDKPFFRAPMRKARCLVPATGYYEWLQTGVKRPYNIRPVDGGLMAMAGIWSVWETASGEPLRSFAILTTDANQRLSAIHHRMPVIVQPEHYAAWLDVTTPRDELEMLLQPANDDSLEAIEVSSRVNSVKNNDPRLLEAV